MKTKEYIEVYIKYEKGKTQCICMRKHKRCSRHCSEEVVERDKLRGWYDCFKVNKYGK